jgi:hypothetical protein
VPNKTQEVAAGVDIAMSRLRKSMRGIQIRTAGFKKDHDLLAKAASNLVVTMVDGQALLDAVKRGTRHRRR